jgi:hypothetical protein
MSANPPVRGSPAFGRLVGVRDDDCERAPHHTVRLTFPQSGESHRLTVPMRDGIRLLAAFDGLPAGTMHRRRANTDLNMPDVTMVSARALAATRVENLPLGVRLAILLATLFVGRPID